MPRCTYRFSLGDSTQGQVGFCFDYSIEMETRDDDRAVAEMKAALNTYGADTCLTGLSILPEPFTHVCIYPNVDKITKDDIVDYFEEP